MTVARRIKDAIRETTRPHGLGRRRAEQVPRQDRLGLEEAGRPDRRRARTGRGVPAAAAGRRALGRRPGDRAAPARGRHRQGRAAPRRRSRRCSSGRSAARPTGSCSSRTGSTIGPSSRTGRRSRRAPRTRSPQDLIDLDAHQGRDRADGGGRRRLAGAPRALRADGDDQGALLRLHDHHAQPLARSRPPAIATTSSAARWTCWRGPRPAAGRCGCSASRSTTCATSPGEIRRAPRPTPPAAVRRRRTRLTGGCQVRRRHIGGSCSRIHARQPSTCGLQLRQAVGEAVVARVDEHELLRLAGDALEQPVVGRRHVLVDLRLQHAQRHRRDRRDELLRREHRLVRVLLRDPAREIGPPPAEFGRRRQAPSSSRRSPRAGSAGRPRPARPAPRLPTPPRRMTGGVTSFFSARKRKRLS